MSRKKFAVGIDMGTTQCNIGVVYNGISQFLHSNDETTNSSITFTETNAMIGIDDTDHVQHIPSNTVFGIKKILGREFEDPVVQRLKRYVPFTITERENKTCVKVFYKQEEQYFTPQEITGFVLESLKKKAQILLKGDVKDAVIAVPGSFTHVQRQATKDAAAAAGLRVLALITETTATAISYQGGRRRFKGETKNVVIVDMGGGKLDVSLITINDESINVRAVSGSTEIGGDHLVEMLMDRVFDEYQRRFAESPPRSPAVLERLRINCRMSMQNFSVLDQLTIRADCFGEEHKFGLYVTRKDYNEWSEAIVKPTLLASLDQVFKSSDLKTEDIYNVILVGGCTCTDEFRGWLSAYFGICEINGRNVNPFNAVVEGAAIYAALLSGDRRVREMTVNDLFQSVDSITPSSASGETPSQS